MGAIRAIGEAGLDALVVRPEVDAMARVGSRHPMGCVIPDMLAGSAERLRALIRPYQEAQVPIAADAAEFDIPDVDQIISDHAEGSYMLTRWLISQGRRRILRVSDESIEPFAWARARQAGYERAMAEAGLAVLPTLSSTILPLSDMTAAKRVEVEARYWMGLILPHLGHIDAMMAITDGHVPSVARAIRYLGLVPNQDILITGYDNYWDDLLEEEVEPTPPAATIDKLNEESGKYLVQLVLDRIDGRLDQPKVTRLIKPRLVIPATASR